MCTGVRTTGLCLATRSWYVGSVGYLMCVGILILSLQGGPLPPTRVAQGFTPGQQAEIVQAHNEWRRRVGSPDLRWSADLAGHAERWAATLAARGCVIQTSRTEDLGENVYFAGPLEGSSRRLEVTITPASVVGYWTSEASDYLHAENACRPGKICGHFTQVVWSSTREVGCGRAVCPRDGQVWVCNYLPAGNTRGQRPY